MFDKRIFHRHAKLIRDAGFEVHLVAPAEEPSTEVDGIRIHGFRPMKGYRERLTRQGDIFRVAKELRGDLYHVHDPDLLLLARRLRRSLRVPVVYDAHEDFPFALRSSRGFSPRVGGMIGWAFDQVERRLAGGLDGIVCPHAIRLRELDAGGERSVFLPNYPPRDVYDVPEPPVHRARTVVYSGLLAQHRGSMMMLDAAERMPDVEFLLLAKFVRENEQKEYEQEVARRALPNLDFRGFVPFAEVPACLSRAGVGVMPWARTPQHLRAAQPSKLYEYMACHLPVVATDLPITRTVVEKTGSGLLHKEGDVNDFAEKVYRILDDPKIAAEMARNGRAAFEQQFSYEVAGRKLVELYGQLLSHGRASAAGTGSG